MELNPTSMPVTSPTKMAPRMLNSLKPAVIVIQDKFPIYQGFKWQTAVFFIGPKPVVFPKTYTNPLKTALYYQSLLDNGQAATRAELAALFGVSRPKITQILNLLKLAPEIRDFIVGLEENDERLQILTERRLRPLVQCCDDSEQINRFEDLINSIEPPSQSACP